MKRNFKRKAKLSIPPKYILLIMTLVCITTMFVSLTLNLSGGPLQAAAGYVFVPMQKGINKIGTFITDKRDDLQTLEEVQAENAKLKTQVDELTSELNTIKLEQYDL